MKNLLICASLALVGVALVGCGAKDDAPTDPQAILKEMDKGVPPGTQPVSAEEATKGMQMMGGKKGK